MGGISSMDRCHQFIDEFGADFVARYGLPAPMVCANDDDGGQGLGVDELHWVVRFYATLYVPAADGGEGGDTSVEVILPGVGHYDPNDSDDAAVAYVASYLDISDDEALARLRKAGLVA